MPALQINTGKGCHLDGHETNHFSEFDGGSGVEVDTADYAHILTAVTVNLAETAENGLATGTGIGTDVPPYPGEQSQLLLQDASGHLVNVTATNLPLHGTDYTHRCAAGDIDGDGGGDFFFGAPHQVTYEDPAGDGEGFVFPGR